MFSSKGNNELNIMKVVVFLFLAGVAASSMKSLNEITPPANHPELDVLARQVYEKFKSETRNEYKFIPELDTLEFEDKHIEFCEPVFCINANLTKGTLRGLGGSELIKLDFKAIGSKINIDMDINFPSLLFDSEYYEMKGNIMKALPLAGKGKLHFGTKDFRFWTKIVLNLEGGTSIEKFENPGFSIRNIFSDTEFDGNIDGIFNAMVEDVLEPYLNRFNRAIATYCGQMAKELLNPIL